MERRAAGTVTARLQNEVWRDILAGRLVPGQRINLEELRARYQVSLSPLREALSRLLSTGLVVPADKRGFRVAGISKKDMEDIARTRLHIEKVALSEAIVCGDDDWEAGVAAALHALKKAASREDGKLVYNSSWEKRHKAFHRALIEACESARLMEFWEKTYDQGVRYRFMAQELGLYHGDSVAEHELIAHLAIERRSEELFKVLDGHLGVSARLLAEMFSEEERADSAPSGVWPANVAP